MQVKKVLSEDVHCKFTQLGFNMLISRLKKMYKDEPSAEVLIHCTEEVNSFLKKYELIMKNDYALISQI